ncbi:MAG: hypothetical protein CM1200mP8_2720 [Chloroflexota bacterium]|nr:MAG: hypothetical protein CM1200mP8_2720 [Chloroflexota bacterium]
MESSSKSNWIKNVLQPAIKRRLERKSEFNNRSGVEIHALYDQDDSDPSDLGIQENIRTPEDYSLICIGVKFGQ